MDTILFDFDGLIVDTESAYQRAWESVLRPDQLAKFAELASGRREEDAARLLRPYFREEIQTEEAALHHKRAMFLSLMEDPQYLRPLRGIRELIEKLSLNKTMHIVSNSSRPLVEGPLRTLSLFDSFDQIFCWSPELKAKPHPDLYLAALRSTNLNSSDVTALEDSQSGLEAAVAAGITPVCIGTNSAAWDYCLKRNIARYNSAEMLVGVDPKDWPRIMITVD